MPRTLAKSSHPPQFSFLELSERGCFLSEGKEVDQLQVPDFLKRAIGLASDVTDVFVWVHGWRNDRDIALQAAGRLFDGINYVFSGKPARYPGLINFKPAFVAVHWPSMSWPFFCGYRKIRERAHQRTENGYAEYALAFLLGYLEQKQPVSRSKGRGVLRASGGFYVHCVGHSFGCRFLAQAVIAAANPSPPTLALLPPNQRFEFTVDTFLGFQMAAPSDIFGDRLKMLIEEAPLQGPIC
jgi:hypothetical protein